ncbi:MAG: glycosyl transferase family 2 [uncultured bacterium]|nr:MAG: glycosyl transferase family 2 [uncultured bacterium]KKU15397.1 MAG: Glycosyltransferase, group 1 family protein [Microgenomates group bacterium GW2011_GWC2_45_8]KKU26221.1 MAG: Glycosyltransferase, group 1 family protein [Microgenomates group bacterium GW2011_GWA2_46_16]
MSKALIVSPYLDHLGGGERYMLSLASVLESLGYDIHFAWDNLEEITHLASMLGIELKDPKLNLAVKKLYISHRPLAMFAATRPYDVVVYLSDGSLPLLGGKKNLVHMQVPFHGVRGRSWQNQLKKHFIHTVIVNSHFTKQVIDLEFGLDSIVLYPPVMPINPAPKENLILSVGRFEPSLNTKHQDVLIEAWRTLSPQLPEWKLVLVGASGSDDWVSSLRKKATGLSIEFVVNASYSVLCTLYAKSKIYWHAAGYGVDEQKNPELTEHFGISTVEAISAGCIPLVVPYGGQREIVTNPALHWTTVEEIITKTIWLTQNLQNIVPNISPYSLENFKQNFSQLLT